MAEPAPLPSLFGRFTVIFQDHDELGRTLARLRKMCAAIEAGAPELSPELSPEPLLAQLEHDLKEHFTAEESPAYFGTVVDEAPALAPQITALKWEHLAMLKATERLTQLAQDEARWMDLTAPTLALVAELERHERAESVLLRQLFFSPEAASTSAGRRG